MFIRFPANSIMTQNPDIVFTTEYIKNVLYFATVRPGRALISTQDVHYFCIDNELVYENYYSDFGPLNLGCVYKYCKILNEKLKQHLNKQTIVHYTSTEAKKKANAAFLLGCYGVLYLSLTPRDALRPLLKNAQYYPPFQDATQGDPIYTISILDCLCGIKKARQLDLFDFQDFNYEEYEKLDKIQGGDLNWIVPGKFLAFIGPVDYSVSLFHPPEMYIDYFKENNVQIVIRLNKRMYDADVFNNAGITHYDLFFPDGRTPPRHILMKFLQIAEEANGAIAVHCKAGLGRTGSLIGSYLIKHYRMSAHEAIGWMRICRPGSVIGHQQMWLEQLEAWLTKQGNLYRKRMYQDVDKLPVHEYGVYSIREKLRNQQPMVYNQPPPRSPPPSSHRIRSDVTSSPLRPQASKIRDAFNKTKETEHYDWHMKNDNSNNMMNRGSQHKSSNVSPRSSGAGEPRFSSIRTKSPQDVQGCPRNNSVRSGLRGKTLTPNVPSTPIPTFRTTQGSVIRTLTDAKNFLMKSSIYNQQRDHQRALNSSVLVTPFRQVVNRTDRGGTINPNISNTARNPLSGPVQRRRQPLGRSPSPSPTRATNTVPVDRFSAKHRTTVREALSNLKLSGPRGGGGGSIGAASVGASSLGACRDAPAGKRAPSVRSDERPTATQGDILNSIKFQRRYRDSLHTEKSQQFNEKSRDFDHRLKTSQSPNFFGTSCVTNAYTSRISMAKERANSTRGNATWRPSPTNYTLPYSSNYCWSKPPTHVMDGKQYGGTKDKNVSSTSKMSPTASRPTSPKGRTRTTSFF